MFTRARLHLTLLYAALLGVTVLLLAGAIGYLAVQETRNTDDRELKIRAEALAADIQGPPPPMFPPPGGRPGEHGPPHLERRGLIDTIIPVRNGELQPPAPDSGSPGLPNLDAARQAAQSGSGRYVTASVEGSEVRVYSLPVVRGGQLVGIVQVERSRYFVNASVTRLALISLAAGLIGLVLSGGAGYWLAGRTLRPIAAALERQRNFAADASHELRTPLTVLLTNAELLTRHPERKLADYQDVIEDMTAEIERLSRLVSNLLTLARADQGKALLAIGPVDLSEVTDTVARRFAPVAAAKGLGLQAEITPEVTVPGDHDRLYQLAVILIDNAVRYTSRGTVTVRVAHERHEGVLSVNDTGPGIAPEHLPHLFERFYRTDTARSAEEGGTGLGLALADWIVKSHRGRIDVVSTPGQGSTFTVHLPEERSSGRNQPGEPTSAAAGAGRMTA